MSTKVHKGPKGPQRSSAKIPNVHKCPKSPKGQNVKISSIHNNIFIKSQPQQQSNSVDPSGQTMQSKIQFSLPDILE